MLWSSLKSKATSAFYRQCIYATPGNGLSHAKQIEYFREPGSYFNSYCLLYTLQVPGTVCVLLLSKQLGDSYCDNPHVVDEEMEAQKDWVTCLMSDITQQVKGFNYKEVRSIPNPECFQCGRPLAFGLLLLCQICLIKRQLFIIRGTETLSSIWHNAKVILLNYSPSNISL